MSQAIRGVKGRFSGPLARTEPDVHLIEPPSEPEDTPVRVGFPRVVGSSVFRGYASEDDARPRP